MATFVDPGTNRHQLFNSLVVCAATTVVGLLLAVTAAYALSRFRFPGRQAGMQVLEGQHARCHVASSEHDRCGYPQCSAQGGL